MQAMHCCIPEEVQAPWAGAYDSHASADAHGEAAVTMNTSHEDTEVG